MTWTAWVDFAWHAWVFLTLMHLLKRVSYLALRIEQIHLAHMVDKADAIAREEQLRRDLAVTR